MGKNEHQTYLKAIRSRYRYAARKSKTANLDELFAICAYYRKYSIRLLIQRVKHGGDCTRRPCLTAWRITADYRPPASPFHGRQRKPRWKIKTGPTCVKRVEGPCRRPTATLRNKDCARAANISGFLKRNQKVTLIQRSSPSTQRTTNAGTARHYGSSPSFVTASPRIASYLN